MSHVKPLGKQGPQPALIGDLCLGDTALGQTIDQFLVGKGKPALLEDTCIDKCPAGFEC